jgi:O-antigen ligase
MAGISLKIEELVLDPATQWIVVLFAGIYSIVLIAPWCSLSKTCMPPARGTTIWQLTFLLIALTSYLLECKTASQSTQAVFLLCGMLMGSVIYAALASPGRMRLDIGRLRSFLIMLLAVLFVACLWRAGRSTQFSYIGRSRWIGPFDNPNLYGLLMAAGLILALGARFQHKIVSQPSNNREQDWPRWKRALYVAVGCVFAFGLWKSYSRGAWLAAGVGALYLTIHWWRSHHSDYVLPADRVRLIVISAATASGVLTILFWMFRYTSNVTIHRAVSASSLNDLSWRNRLAAWEGTLQMIWDRPCFGFGWGASDAFYKNYYSAPRIEDTGLVIHSNIYLMLGATLGIPALFCLCMHIITALIISPIKTFSSNKNAEDVEKPSLLWIKAVCRSAAVALAVGFWFDGGLFTLPTATTFWMLLRLGEAEME